MSSTLIKIETAIPQHGVIEELERFIDLAKRGKLLSVAICGTDSDGITHTGFVASSNRAGIVELTAGSALLHHKIVSHWAGS